jgi:outer membrane receptor for ferrienterochelin and colicin
MTHAHLFNRHTRQTVGVQFRYDTIDDVGLYQTAGRERINTVRVDDVNQFSVGTFYENEIEWTERFRSILGLRADHHYFDVASDLNANSGNEDDYIVSPKLSFIYTATDQIELYASAGLGFHSNDARGTTIEINPGDLTAADKVDPLVRSTGIHQTHCPTRL